MIKCDFFHILEFNLIYQNNYYMVNVFQLSRAKHSLKAFEKAFEKVFEKMLEQYLRLIYTVIL